MERIVDLTRSYTDAVAGFHKSVSKTLNKDGWNATTLNIYSHAGTHMDAPTHFEASTQTIDEIPVTNFIGKAWVIDLRHIGYNGLISAEDITSGIKGKFSSGDSLLLWTNWSKKHGTPSFRDELPRISDEAAHWCVTAGVKMLAVEPPSVADVNNMREVTEIHKILLNHVIIIEGIINLEALKKPCVELIALPIKVGGGDGAPCRVVAIEKYG